MSDSLRDIAMKVLGGANACKEHLTDIKEGDVVSCVAAHYEEGSCSKSSGVALVRLDSGQWAVIREWQDTSGHG